MLPHSDPRNLWLATRWRAKSGPPHAAGVFTLSACLGRQSKGGRVMKPAGCVAALAWAAKPLLRATPVQRAS